MWWLKRNFFNSFPLPNSVFLLGIINGILSQHFISHLVVFGVVVVVVAFAVFVVVVVAVFVVVVVVVVVVVLAALWKYHFASY